MARKVSAVARAGLSVILAAGLSLAGCAAPGNRDAAATGRPSPSPTGACPRVDDLPQQNRACVTYDGDAAMAENRRYREPIPLGAEAKAQLAVYIEPARKALESLRPPPTADDVVRALASIGLDERDIQTSDAGTGIRFGASATGGCVRGSVGLDGTVQVVAGGYIMDGGCLAMNGH